MKLVIHADGGARGNPGLAAYGVVIENETGKVIARLGQALGIKTNNQAEYGGVIGALEFIKKTLVPVTKITALEFYLDSDLIVNQLSGKYKIKSPSWLYWRLGQKSRKRNLFSSYL